MKIAKEGPTITANSTLFRSNAIIITDPAIKALELPGLVYKKPPSE